jgi:transmembrane sensor
MQERNKYTEIEDFLADDSFQSWVRLKVDLQGWEEWTLENPDRAKLVEESRLWLLAMTVPHKEIPASVIQSGLEITWEKINKKEQQANQIQRPVIQLWQNSWFKGAAAVLLFGFLSTWFYNNHFVAKNSELTYNELIKEEYIGLVEQTNHSSKPQIITLSDGSSVLLKPNSKLSYPKIFTGNKREVYLSGEAFFEISKNPKKPFFVYANEIVTKVVGTSFRIKAYADLPNVEVIVRTGKVKVRSNPSIANSKEKEIVLLPNQALRFTRKNLTFNKITDITQDESLVPTQGNIEQLSFEFTDIPVTQIFKTIEQAYLVNIDFPVDKLKNCHLTTSLNDQPLPEKLKIICKSIGNNTNYEMNGNQIIITSDGSN